MKGYRLYCPDIRDVIETKHVKFDESKTGINWTESMEYSDSQHNIWTNEHQEHDITANYDACSTITKDENTHCTEEDRRLNTGTENGEPSENEINTSVESIIAESRTDSTDNPLRRPRKIVRNPFGRKGKPKPDIELNFMEVVEPKTVEKALQQPESPYWQQAMKEELDSLQKRGTWEITDLPPGKNAINSKWVFKIKTNPKETIERFKARLVAKGFSQRKDIDFNETYYSECDYWCIRILLIISQNAGWVNHHIDVNNAYLYEDLAEDIYMKFPPGIDETSNEDGKILRLLRPIYVLRQSARNWNNKLYSVLEEQGCRRLESCTCIYSYNQDALIAVYVDDLAVFAKNQETLDKIESKLKGIFEVKNLGTITYFLGVEMKYDNDSVILSQKKYATSILENFRMDECAPVATPLDPSLPMFKEDCPKTKEERDKMKNVPYRELIGSLLYLSGNTRPDITFSVTKLAQFSGDPGPKHWAAAKHLLRYLKGTLSRLLLYKRGDSNLKVYSDADWASD